MSKTVLKYAFKDNHDDLLIRAVIDNDKVLVGRILRTDDYSDVAMACALWSAAYHDRGGICDILVESGAIVQAKLDGRLMRYVDDGNISSASEMIAEGADLYQYGHYVLYQPVLKDDFPMVHFLFQMGVSPNICFNKTDMKCFVQNANGCSEDDNYEITDEMLSLVQFARKKIDQDTGNAYLMPQDVFVYEP